MIAKLKTRWIEKTRAALLLFLATMAVALTVITLLQTAWAAPFLVCDPYPTTAVQPTEFVVTINGVAAPVVTPAVDVTGSKALRLDLGPLNLAGAHTVTAKARNMWGESAASAPFSFTAGPPSALGGIGLVAQ